MAGLEHSSGQTNGYGHSHCTSRGDGGMHDPRMSPSRELQSHAVDDCNRCGRNGPVPASDAMVMHPQYTLVQVPATYMHSPMQPQNSWPMHPGHPAQQGVSISPQKEQPSAMTVNMPPDIPEDPEAAAKNLEDMQRVWDEWHSFKERKLRGEQALSELKRLSNRTVSLAGRASQASLNRCQAVELLHIATGFLDEHNMEHDARYLESLAEKMGQMPSRGGALFQNIQNGGRQSLTSVSKPTVNTKLAAKADAKGEAKAGSNAVAKARAWIENKGSLATFLAAAGIALVGQEVLKRTAGAVPRMVMSHHQGGLDSFAGEESRRRRRHSHAAERRRIQCEVANEKGREYLQELRQNRLNPFWHKDPPLNTCPMPLDSMPWRPEHHDY